MAPDEATFFRKLADNSPLFIGMCDMQLVPFYVNEAGRRLVGLDDLRQFIDTPVREFFFPEDQDFIVNDFFSRVLKEGRAETEIRFRHFKTGEPIWMTYDVFFLAGDDGVPVGLATVSREITETKRAEAALRDSEERFASFMRHLPGLAWIKQTDGAYVFVNDAAEKAFQAPRHEIYGRRDEELFPAETAAQFRANDAAALASGSGIIAIETLRHDDGMLRHSIVSKFPIRDYAGVVSGIGGVAMDVTDRINAEEALKEAAARLRVVDRHKDEFLATLAHELRNPLAPIYNGLHVIRSLGEKDDPEKKARIEKIMERQLSHLVRLVDDLLDIARISRGKVTLKRGETDIHGPIHQAVEMSRHLIQEAGVTLRLDMADEPLVVRGDAVRLTQIFANLLNNATKYTGKGGVIGIVARRESGEVRVSVADTGVGIPEDMLPHVFDLFTQIGDRHERPGGLGIGLALVRQLVELHGGSVSASSPGVGHGSVFTVRLPLI